MAEKIKNIEHLEEDMSFWVNVENGSHDMNGLDGSHDFLDKEPLEDYLVDDPTNRRIIHEAEQILAESVPVAIDEFIEEVQFVVEAEKIVHDVFEHLCEEASKQGRTIDSYKKVNDLLLPRVVNVSLDQQIDGFSYN